jgi:hypothetical protein
VASGGADYPRFTGFPGTDERDGSGIEDEGGIEVFAGCLGFFASLLPRCWPLAM